MVFANPFLPAALQQVRITGLRVGAGSIDLLVTRRETDVGINVLHKVGGVALVVMK